MALFKFLKQLFGDFSKDKVGQMSAAFAYVAVFALGPLLLVVISVVSFVYGERAATGALFEPLSEAIGADAAETVQDVVASTHNAGGGALAFVTGAVGVLLAAAALTTQLQNSFNMIFGVVPDPKAGLKRMAYVKLKSVLLVILGGAAVTASVLGSTLASGLGEEVQDELGLPVVTLEIFNNLISLAVLAGLLYLVYKLIPDVKLPRRVAAIAALSVAALFLIGKMVLAIIIGNNGTAGAYGAAASLVTLLLWVYYSGQILFLGAEGIKIYGENRALIYPPKRYNLRRETLHLDLSGYKGRLAEAFAAGFKKGRSQK